MPKLLDAATLGLIKTKLGVHDFPISLSKNLSEISTDGLDVSMCRRFNSLLGVIVKYLTPARSKNASLNFSLELANFEALILALRAGFKNKDLANVQIRIGLGGNVDYPAPRLVAVLNPVFALQRAIWSEGIRPPRLVVFKSNNTAVNLNGLNKRDVLVVSLYTFRYVASFIKAYYPQIVNDVFLLSDNAETSSELFSNHVVPLARQLPVDEDVARLGRKRSSTERSMEYATFHAFELGCLWPRRIDRADQWNELVNLKAPDHIIVYGGFPERLFKSVIEKAIDLAPEENYWKIPKTHWITRIGSVPAYFPKKLEPRIDNSFDFNELKKRGDIEQSVKDDYEYLEYATTHYMIEFEQFLANFRRNNF